MLDVHMILLPLSLSHRLLSKQGAAMAHFIHHASQYGDFISKN